MFGAGRGRVNSSASISVSAQDGIVAIGKAHARSAPSPSCLAKVVTLETVPVFAWLHTDRSRLLRLECWPLPFSTPLSFRRSVMLWPVLVQKVPRASKQLCPDKQQTRCDVCRAAFDSLSLRSFSLTLACPGQ